jgi:hypothetical protein
VTARWLLTTALRLIEQRGLTLVGGTVAELENAHAVRKRSHDSRRGCPSSLRQSPLVVAIIPAARAARTPPSNVLRTD